MSDTPITIENVINETYLKTQLLSPLNSWCLQLVNETRSTNADLVQQLKTSHPNNKIIHLKTPIVRLAAQQTAGYGRHGRQWHAKPGEALLFSIAYPLKMPVAKLAGLSLTIGVSLIEALRKHPLKHFGKLLLKWPNDILLDGHKLAGILIETAIHTPTKCVIVIGIGINLHSSPLLEDDTSAPLKTNCLADLFKDTLITPIISTHIFASILNTLSSSLVTFEQKGFAAFKEKWWKNHAFADQAVILFDQQKELVRGIAVGINDDGQLLIDIGNKIMSITTGDISIKASS